jgi:hypothetical protein
MSRPLVIGYPRSGFSLLISVIAQLRQSAGVAAPEPVVSRFCAGAGAQMARRIAAVFEARGVGKDLLYNGNFRELAGGPKWLRDARTACFRKYIGVKGGGDFTLITSHPREVMGCYDIVHSHVAPAGWAASPDYADYQRFASLRDPAGTLASACFSLNALASEYIQKFVPAARDDDGLRQRLALYKLSDPAFFTALIAPFKAWLEEFSAVAGKYNVMRWEELISAPVPTILRLAKAMQMDVSAAQAAAIWAKLDHVNLTGAHAHNLRRGHGVVGGWRRWLTNEHLVAMREAGLFEAAGALGYAPPDPLVEADYTPFQRALAAALARGRVIRVYEDEDLFGFAFNKSNIDWSRFGFRSYGWRAHTQIERSSFTDEALLMAAWDAAEEACALVNEALAPWVERAPGAEGEAAAVSAMAAAAAPLFEDEAAWRCWAGGLTAAETADPVLLQAVGVINIVAYGQCFYALPQSLGPVDLRADDVKTWPGVLMDDSLASLLDRLKELA